MKNTVVETRRGARCRVLEGGRGHPLVFLHGPGGLFSENPFLDGLAERYHVLAPEWRGATLLTGGVDFGDMDALRDFYIGNARRMGMAGKILFPIPDRHVSRRLYRLSAPTLVAWGASDRLIPPVYAERWAALIPTPRW